MAAHKNISMKIEKHLGRKINFLTEIKLRSVRGVISIDEWNVEEEQLSVDDLNDIDVDAELASHATFKSRQTSYPVLAEQLDLLYHDMAADKGTKAGEWFKSVKKVKDDNPK